MLRFDDLGDFFELDLVERAGEQLPSFGDAYMTVRLASAGFTGHNDLWVSQPALRQFCRDLVLLERDRRGRAALGSMTPDELTLTVRAVDSAGHMAVEGSTGYHVQRNGGVVWHAVHFGFDFEPSQLLAATAVAWVRRCAK